MFGWRWRKLRKGTRKFERKRKRYKLCREETAAVNKGFIRRYISMYVLTHGHTIIKIKRC